MYNKYKNKLIKFKTILSLLSKGLKYWKIIEHLDIHGWLTINEAVELYDLSLSLPKELPIVVEIGSWLGKSSVILAKGIASKKYSKLYCIDPFNADKDLIIKLKYNEYSSQYDKSLKNIFINNMTKCGVYDMINILQGYSHDFFKDFPYKIDMLFIDGDHEYKSVYQDMLDWTPLLKPKGILCLHDVSEYGEFRGPWLVAKEKIINNPGWSDIKIVDSLLSTKKVSDDY